MARQKGTANLSASLEVLAGAPLDARSLVDTVADLTVTSNFPYPYVGMTVTVKATGDKYTLMSLPVSSSANWKKDSSGGGGGGLLPHLIVTSETGSTVTAVSDQSTTTLTETSVGVFEADLDGFGTYTIHSIYDGEDISRTLKVDTVKIYSVKAEHARDGSTATPTNDVAVLLWLGYSNESYETISEVLADKALCVSLLANDEVVDYLVRSIAWVSDFCNSKNAMDAIGASGYATATLYDNSIWHTGIQNSEYADSVIKSIPVMTSNTEPSGECYSDPVVGNSGGYIYAPYSSFDKVLEPENGWYGREVGKYVGYDFGYPILPKAASMTNLFGRQRSFSFKIQGSMDKSNWTDISDVIEKAADETETYNFALTASTGYEHFRLILTAIGLYGYCNINDFNVYGLPIGYVQDWLRAGNITDKDYTTLAEVLNDGVTLMALMASSSAVDYLVTATSWAIDVCSDEHAMTYIGLNNYASNTLAADSSWFSAIMSSPYRSQVLNAKVPAMTGYTTPSGEVRESDCLRAGLEGWRAFDNDGSTNWCTFDYTAEAGIATLSYTFPTATKIFGFEMYVDQNASPAPDAIKVEGTNDDSVFDTLYNNPDTSGFQKGTTFVGSFTNPNSYVTYKFSLKRRYWDSRPSHCLSVSRLQLYGREDV